MGYYGGPCPLSLTFKNLRHVCESQTSLGYIACPGRLTSPSHSPSLVALSSGGCGTRLWGTHTWNVHSSYASPVSTSACHLPTGKWAATFPGTHNRSHRNVSLGICSPNQAIPMWEAFGSHKNRMVSLHLLCSPWESETTFQSKHSINNFQATI